MPVYNVSNVIKRAIHSIIDQTYSPIECIIINDATPDNSMYIIQNILKQYTGDIDFKIIKHQTNKGLSQARNSGLNTASGDYIYYLDSDDEITPDCISKLIETAKQYPQANLIQGCYKTYPEEEIDFFELNSKDLPTYIDGNYQVNHCFFNQKKIPITAWNKLIKREFILKHNILFKEGIIYEDLPWIFIIVRHLDFLAFNKDITYKYYKQPTSISKSSSYSRGLESFSVIIRDCYDNTSDVLSRLQKTFIFHILLLRIYDIYRLYPEPDIIKKYIALSKYILNDSIKTYHFRDSIKSFGYIIILHSIRKPIFRKVIEFVKARKVVKIYS